MKKIMLAAAFALLSCETVFAQFTNTSSSSSTKSKTISTTASTDTWSSLYFQWNPSSMVPDKGDNQSFTGLALGYNQSISLMQNQPLFLEVGGAVQYSFFSFDGMEQEDDKYDDYLSFRWNMVSLKVPVSLTYNWQVSEKVAIAPYAGLTLRFNVYGSQRYKITDDDFRDYLDDDDIDEIEESKSIFDKDDMREMEMETANRFQLGWQIGVNFRFNNKFYIGAAYGSDFIEYSKKIKISQPSITAGLIF